MHLRSILLATLAMIYISCDTESEEEMEEEEIEILAPGTYIYVSDAAEFNSGPWRIMRYDENGKNASVFIDENLGWPQDIFFLEDENQVLISNLNKGQINRHDATSGKYIDSFASSISGPTRMKLGPDNLLYVLQWLGNGLVLRYQLDGTFVDEFTDVAIEQSIGLDWDADGNLYVSSFKDATVRKFDTSGKDLGLFIDTQIAGPTNIWFDADGNLLVNDWKGNAIEKFDADGAYMGKYVDAGLNQPEGVDFLPNGDLLIGSGGTKEVKQYDANGELVKTFVAAGTSALVRPNAVRIREVK